MHNLLNQIMSEIHRCTTGQEGHHKSHPASAATKHNIIRWQLLGPFPYQLALLCKGEASNTNKRLITTQISLILSRVLYADNQKKI